MLSLFRQNAALRRLTLGFAAAQLGGQIGWIALVWWIVNGVRSPALLGALFVAYQVPMILSAPIVGAMLDRLNAKRVATSACITGTVAVSAVAVLAYTGALTLTLLFALLVLVSLTAPATLTYRRTLIGQLVEADELPAAYAMFSLGTEVSILMGPAAGGLMVGHWSTAAALCAFAAGNAAYLFAIVSSRYRRNEPPQSGKLDVFAGAREIATRPLVLTVTLLTFFFFLAYGPLEVALPIAARAVFHTGASGYGFMWTAYAIGSVAGLVLLRARYQRFPTTSVLCAIAVMWGIFAGGIGVTRSLTTAMALLFVGGLLWSPYNALESSFMQLQVPERVQGAVFSMQSSFLYTLAVPLGAMIGGWALSHVSPQNVLLASGAACVLAGIAGYVALRVQRCQTVTADA